MYYINPYGVCNEHGEFSLSHFVSFFICLSFSSSLTRNPLVGGVEPFLFSPPHTTVTQPLAPQLTGIVNYNVYFLLAYPGMHQVQFVDIPGSAHDQAPFAELHHPVLDATGVALIIQSTD